MTAAVEREVSESYFFYFGFDVSFMGHSASTGTFVFENKHGNK
jgi:hypothetical protein